jgi:uncharacterized protein (TIGR00299 family) protein
MSHVLFLDPVGGIAGDMFLAACLDLGVSLEALRAELAKLGELGFRLETRRTFEASIAGTHLDVIVTVEEPHERSYVDIVRLIDSSGLSARVKDGAKAVFRAIGEAEARVHHKSLETIHFHEVGAVDSIVDVCGAAICLELLGWPKVVSLPPPAGGGTAKTVHGIIPLPAPATLEVMKGRRLRPSGPGERTTPTGAGLLAVFAEEVERMPEFAVDRIGYGVGTKSWDDAPNVVRAVLGRAASKHTNEAGLLVEANLDDATGQWVARAIEVLMEVGAAEAWSTPVTGRKGRPGFVLSALCSSAKLEAVRQVFIRETPTLGVRISSHERRPLDRDWVEVATPWGQVRVKRGLDGGLVVNIAPEYDDCLVAAKAHGVPVKEVWQAALAGARV